MQFIVLMTMFSDKLENSYLIRFAVSNYKYLYEPARNSPVLISIRPHRMHEMRTIATDVPVASCLCHSVCLSVMRLRCAKAAKRIEALLTVRGSEKFCLLYRTVLKKFFAHSSD